MPEYIERGLLPEKKEYWDSDFGAGWDACLDEITKLPSADVWPVKRGKWKHGVFQICFFDWHEVAPLASVPNFCPNCGADMRGGEQDGV